MGDLTGPCVPPGSLKSSFVLFWGKILYNWLWNGLARKRGTSYLLV